MAVRAIRLVAAAALCVLAAAGCATLPDTDATIARHTGQAARFDDASGPVSAQKSAAVLAELKRKSGDVDILEKQIALEQAINDSPLVLGNKVSLLQDGGANDRLVVDERDHAHGTLALRAFERIDFVHLVDEAGPG